VAVTVLQGNTPATTGAYNNGAIEVPALQSEVITVDAENVVAALIDSGYYAAADFTGLE
jgi:putative multiple sugar transport system substrate-binding protein